MELLPNSLEKNKKVAPGRKFPNTTPIKELLDEGFTLEAAANKVEKRMELINSTFKKFKNRHKKV